MFSGTRYWWFFLLNFYESVGFEVLSCQLVFLVFSSSHSNYKWVTGNLETAIFHQKHEGDEAILPVSHPKTNMEPKNGGLFQMIFLFKQVTFRFKVSFRGCIRIPPKKGLVSNIYSLYLLFCFVLGILPVQWVSVGFISPLKEVELFHYL